MIRIKAITTALLPKNRSYTNNNQVRRCHNNNAQKIALAVGTIAGGVIGILQGTVVGLFCFEVVMAIMK
jgi:tetrahydromethanopterin S-methyltransferase subunit G